MPFALMNPYGMAAIALLVASAFAGTYLKGRMDGRSVCDNRIAAMVAEAAQRGKTEQTQAHTAAKRLEVAHAKTRVEFRTITKEVEKIVEKPVYRDVCLDADGLRAVNAALTGASPPAPEPSDALPGLIHP